MLYMHATPIFSQKNRPIGYQVHKKIATPTKFYRIWCSMLKLQLPIYKSCIKTKSCGILFQQFFWHNVRNGILLPKLFWPTVRKHCSSDREKLLKFEAEGREFSKFLRSLEQCFLTVGQNNFGNKIPYLALKNEMGLHHFFSSQCALRHSFRASFVF